MEGIRIIRADNPERSLYKCGHEGPKSFLIKIFRNNEEIKDREKCPNCAVAFLREFAIPCSFCGRPIVPGNQVIQIGERIRCVRKVCAPANTGSPSGYWTGRYVDVPRTAQAK